jgi:hypothetical protein
MDMLPQTHFDPQRPQPHEAINEIHVHSYTMQQLFLPTSESREFTREAAAKAFGEHILPADKRVAVPELVQLERDLNSGKSVKQAEATFTASVLASEMKLAQKKQKEAALEEQRTTRVDTDRFEFRFKDMNVNHVGPKGRSRTGTGWRYGLPHQDRKTGQVKIPTKVE